MGAKLKIVGLDVEISGGTRHERKLAMRAAMQTVAGLIAGAAAAPESEPVCAHGVPSSRRCPECAKHWPGPALQAATQCAWETPLEEQFGRQLACERCKGVIEFKSGAVNRRPRECKELPR